tara:strand:+ start:1221 stop:1481 length:261 start_codon:yes stop_codon:yes gene_type:complete
MDNHLLYCMLCNYRDLYIQDRTRQGLSKEYIDYILEYDIDPWIEHFHQAYLAEEEVAADKRRQELVKAKLKAKLEAAIAEGKEDRS